MRILIAEDENGLAKALKFLLEKNKFSVDIVSDGGAEMDVVWTYVGFIRKKFRQLGSRAEIRTVRGAGYSLEERKC